MEPSTWTFVILAAGIAAFLSGRVALPIIAVGVSLSLWATGILPLNEALAGFGDPTVLFIATLFIVSESLDATGVTAWVGQQVVTRAGRSRWRLIVIIIVLVALLSAFISINGAVAALVPVVVVVAVRAGIVPSKLLIPLAFGASAGSMLTFAGTPVNILVSDAAASAGERPFGFFEFALVGIPLVLLTTLITLWLGDRLLPDRTPEHLAEVAPDAREHAKALRESYAVSLDTGTMFSARAGVAEVLIAPRSSLIGRTVSPGMMTRDESLVILGVRREGAEPIQADGQDAGGLTLQAGDAVLVQGPWASLNRYVSSPDVIAVTSPQTMQRAIPLGRGAKRALVILVAMIVLLATGVVPPAVAGFLAVGALLFSRTMTLPETYRAVDWTTVILIAGMVPLSRAFMTTGAADIIADGVLGVVGTSAPTLALLILCTLTIVLSQFISNAATVIIMIPIAASIAGSMELSILPFMMALTVAGAAALLTPVATPANLMVMQPGGYRFGDYWKLGLPLTLVFLAMAVLYVPLVWPF